jgi:hypothetical protein
MNDEKLQTMTRELVRKCTTLQIRIAAARRRLEAMSGRAPPRPKKGRRKRSLREKI